MKVNSFSTKIILLIWFIYTLKLADFLSKLFYLQNLHIFFILLFYYKKIKLKLIFIIKIPSLFYLASYISYYYLKMALNNLLKLKTFFYLSNKLIFNLKLV